MKYLPFLTGVYTTAPGLLPLAKASEVADRFVFQIDDQYEFYLQNKVACRQENINKYYCEHELFPQTIASVNDYIASQLQTEYPSLFEYAGSGTTRYLSNAATGEILKWNDGDTKLLNDSHVSVFDALCSQVQEDFAICQLHHEKDWLSAIHLCAPNHWAATDKIGRPFNVVHAPVAGMQKTFVHYFKMLQSIVTKGPFTRFAWGIATDDRLNHHPLAPEGIDKKFWAGRTIMDGAELFIRTERQNLVGFPAVNAFLFTIRTYFYKVTSLDNEEKKQLWSAVRSMSPESISYKGLDNAVEFLSKKLFEE